MNEFTTAIQDALGRNATIDEFVRILREHRDKGLTARSASEALEALRTGADQQTEDRILEILDIVSGFCAPHLRVWSAA